MVNFVPVIITTTGDDREVLDSLAKALVDRRLAACVQISGPITSCYRWEGKVESAEEFSCSIKTASHLQDQVESVVNELHNYDVPQLITVEVNGGSKEYLNWVQAALEPNS